MAESIHVPIGGQAPLDAEPSIEARNAQEQSEIGKAKSLLVKLSSEADKTLANLPGSDDPRIANLRSFLGFVSGGLHDRLDEISR